MPVDILGLEALAFLLVSLAVVLKGICGQKGFPTGPPGLLDERILWNQIIFAVGLLGDLVLILLPVYGRDDTSHPQISFVFPFLHRVLFWLNS